MAVRTLSDPFIRGLKPGDETQEYRDAATPGLILRIGKRGRKVWEVTWTGHGMRKRIALGEYPNLSLQDARRLASEKKSAPLAAVGPDRVSDLWNKYRAEVEAMRSFHDIESAWRVWVLPLIGNVRLRDLSLADANYLLDEVRARSSAYRSKAVLRYANPAFRWAASKGWTNGNPFRDVVVKAENKKRERVLDPDERRRLMAWARTEPYPWGAIFQLLCLTGQRSAEVSGMRWGEIQGDLWLIPEERHKGKRGHVVPLSRAAQAVLEGVPKMDEEFLFSFRSGQPVKQPAHVKKRIDKATGIENWRVHDIRRTAATVMAENGVDRFAVAQVLGHVDASVTGIYDRSAYVKEKRTALERLALYWTPPEDGENVVQIGGENG